MSLTRRSISKNNISEDGARALASALKTNNKLITLKSANVAHVSLPLTDCSIENNNIGADGARALAEALKANKMLTAL